jgi:hypothetical protein
VAEPGQDFWPGVAAQLEVTFPGRIRCSGVGACVDCGGLRREVCLGVGCAGRGVVARVFISYASEDIVLADEVRRWLADDLHEVSLAQDLRVGIAAREVGDRGTVPWWRLTHGDCGPY